MLVGEHGSDWRCEYGNVYGCGCWVGDVFEMQTNSYQVRVGFGTGRRHEEYGKQARGMNCTGLWLNRLDMDKARV